MNLNKFLILLLAINLYSCDNESSDTQKSDSAPPQELEATSDQNVGGVPIQYMDFDSIEIEVGVEMLDLDMDIN